MLTVKDLIEQNYLKSAQDLMLVSKLIVETIFDGLHQSNRIGFGQEFSQYRNYQIGDDLRFLDWKLFARSERYFVKLSDVESHQRLRLIVDNSHSMEYNCKELSKLDYAKFLMAVLSYIGHNQRDKIIISSINRDHIYSQNFYQSKTLYPVLESIIQITSSGNFPTNEQQNFDQLDIRSKREIILFISDFYQESNEIDHFIKYLTATNNDITIFHMMNESEFELSEKVIVYQDLESNKTVQSRKDSLYKEKLDSFIKQKQEFCLLNNCHYQLIKNSEDVTNVIRQFVKDRATL